MDNSMFSWWQEVLRYIITTLVFGFYIALTFFSFRGSWDFLTDFEYYATTVSATSIAWFLRWIWSNKGLEIKLVKSQDIKDKQEGKEKLIQQVNSNNLTDLLEVEINKVNNETKLKEYRNKCERNKKKYKGRRFGKKKYEYWNNERIECDKEDFNLDIRKTSYYKFDIDTMLSSTYKSGSEVETRGNLNKEVLGSFRTNIITLIAFALLGALQVFIKEYSSEDLFVLLGRLLIFVMNIYSGLTLGMSFVDSRYSKDLSKDYVFLKSFLQKNKVEGYSR